MENTMHMSTHSQTLVTEKPQARFGHALVIGSSISGLTAARVLTEHFERVTIVDRDGPPEPFEFRRGVPQARHAHRLLPRGQMILEEQFPGLVDELLALGAIAIDAEKEVVIDYRGMRHTRRARPQSVTVSCSRALLESTIYRRLASSPGIHFIQKVEVTGLLVDERHERVTGVRLQCIRCQTTEMELSTDLVVDTSGRNSKSPQWLEALGYTPPEEWSIDSSVGYATRIYERPADFDVGWDTLYIRPTPPNGTRGGIIVPIEGNRWHVTLIGVAGDHPPHDHEGFLAFANSLPTSRLYNAIKDTKPLSGISGFHLTANRIRRYDKLPRYLEGFLVYGDAVYIMNPVYAQGMTAAAVGSQALDRCLMRQPSGDLMGLSRAFQKQLSLSLGQLWHTVTSHDWHWPATTITDNSDRIYPN